MNSIQESTNELNAAIRYAENAITSAKQTIESMQFRQDMAMKQHTEQTGREQALEAEVSELNDIIDRMADDSTGDSVTIKQLNDKVQGQYDDIVMLEREVADLKERLKMETAALHRFRKERSIKRTMRMPSIPRPRRLPPCPAIPKDVAIAIFREGIKQGVYDACDEIDNSDSVEVSDYILEGGFEVHFTKYVDLTEHINTDWMRGKVGNYEESNAIATLKGLCEDKEFECRIHGVDDNPTNND